MVPQIISENLSKLINSQKKKYMKKKHAEDYVKKPQRNDPPINALPPRLPRLAVIV